MKNEYTNIQVKVLWFVTPCSVVVCTQKTSTWIITVI